MGKKVTTDQIVKMYEKKGCNITSTCAALGITRQTFYNRRRNNKALSDKLDDVDESLLDFAESKLMEHISNDNITALLFFLKTKGKKRGYVEQIDNRLIDNPFEQLMKELDKEESEE